MANSDGYIQQVVKTSTDACSHTHTHTHTQERDGDSARSARAFRGAESTSRNLRSKTDMENNRGELGPSPQHFVVSDARYLFIALPFITLH